MITIRFDHSRRRSNGFGDARFLILPKFVQILPKFARFYPNLPNFAQISPQENFLRDAAASPTLTLHWFRYCFCAVTVSKLQFYSWLAE